MNPDGQQPVVPVARHQRLMQHRRVPLTSPLAEGPPASLGKQCGAWPLMVAQQLVQVRAYVAVEVSRHMQPSLEVTEPSLVGVRGRLALVVSELGGNAFRHAQAPVTVSLARLPGSWLVDVSDGTPLAAPVVEHYAVADGHGRGLPVVVALATEVGWHAEDDLKHVWAVVPDEVPPELAQLLK